MWADDASKIDMLAYEPYANLICEIATSERMNPLTIGLFGNWGSGKSTLLHLIEQNTMNQTEKRIAVVTVNAWMFEGYDDAKTALMESILQSLQENQTFFKESTDKIKNLIKRVDWIRVGSTALKKGIPLSLSLLAGNPLPMLLGGFNPENFDSEKEIGQHLDKASQMKKDYINAPQQENIIENVRKFREDFVNIIRTSKIDNLIIMIDDLDRCNPDRIIETLEAIKLFLAVEKTTFVIAMDENIITYSIKRKYPQLDDVDIDVSTDYIEKIVQLPIRIAELAETDIKNYMLLLISEMYLSEDVLNQLINQLRDKGIFVKGEIISGKEIVEIINCVTSANGNKYKQGYSQSDFEEQIQIFNSIGSVIAATLKGNPRQTKRFLNTFYMRKRLAEIQRIELNLSVLAKLMVLEYTDRDLFRELYQWQFENAGIPKPLSDIENQVLNEGLNDEEKPKTSQEQKNSAWFGDKIKRWIGVEPTNLSEVDLSQYFYLARDSVSDKKLFSINLNQEERKIINQICNPTVSEIIRKKKIEELKEMDEVTRNEIIKGIISKYNQDKNHLWVLIELYKMFQQYKPKILEELKKYKRGSITPNEILLFKQMDKETFDKLKDYYINEKNSSKKLWEIG
ncbi:P-loop NTPase fold protein [Lysinibacillus sp. FSL K6-4013]|uniref:KAP family P-loop NTPase fold protein n=1 Tax=Lysinibacillus sp. FSL K6-4013 TaxID=2921504 RepID=UPI00315A1BC5